MAPYGHALTHMRACTHKSNRFTDRFRFTKSSSRVLVLLVWQSVYLSDQIGSRLQQVKLHGSTRDQDMGVSGCLEKSVEESSSS